MKIFKFELEKKASQIIRMPEKSEIMDIQIQHGRYVMWALVNPNDNLIEVKINIYGTGFEISDKMTKDEYITTIQDGIMVWHFFMNYEV